ncbi:acetoacetate decarboxylase family protein [Sediminicola luteus]|uniref:PKD domain-containing protein n=1 Tax=Sediminicola luteus TaxID=319238 RepID=A0A2A4G355_9FLAO|nr:acetoacetate decarboxylase family protein [Sediminicola luteus]PCE62861.1 hypothetical protein B7P33_16410 [Sediminicola luteus]
MNKSILTFLLISIFMTSCSNEDTTETLSVVADFETEILLGENQAIVSLKNLSRNATSYSWSFPNGTSDGLNEENPTATYIENGAYTITLVASNGTQTDTKTIEITIDSITENSYVPYRYLENDGIFMYYETENEAVYRSLIPDAFNMPSRMVVFAFFNDFYKLDYGASPYKENALSILVEYQGEEFFHCVYMPVTDEHSMWAGILGLGLPKTMGEIDFYREDPIYRGEALNQLGGTMDMRIDTENYVIDSDAKQALIDLQKLKSLQIRNGKIVVVGNSGGNDNSVIQTAKQYPNRMTLTFGEASLRMNTEEIAFDHPLDLTPSQIIGGFYLKNTIPFGLTGNPF